MTKLGVLKIILFVAVLATAIGIAYRINLKDQCLPIYNPADLNPELVDESVRDVTKLHRVADFELVNQLGETTTQANFEGKIYVADFFFTTCTNICIDMTTQMQRLSREFADDEEVMFLSHSVTPEIDSVPVLYDFAMEYGADVSKWILVTGDKKQIYDLARKSYFAITTEGDGGATDFIHTENFVLIDKEKRIRGYYDGTNPEEINQLIDDIAILKYEYK